jgi:CRP-like cAMP-binding protein
LEADEDFISQGDVPKVAALVVSGMAARYHLLGNGRRQYLSFHMSGDLPDAQGLFVTHMDHALCALGPAAIASIPHSEMIKAFVRRPEPMAAPHERRGRFDSAAKACDTASLFEDGTTRIMR